jgi:hypothetical protein
MDNASDFTEGHTPYGNGPHSGHEDFPLPIHLQGQDIIDHPPEIGLHHIPWPEDIIRPHRRVGHGGKGGNRLPEQVIPELPQITGRLGLEWIAAKYLFDGRAGK